MSTDTTKEAALVPQQESGILSKSDINTLSRSGIIPDGTPLDQVLVFAKICRERSLSPFSKEIYLVNYGGRYNVITGINGFRRLACDTGEFAGCDDAEFDKAGDGTFKTAAELKTESKLPKTCTITVYRLVHSTRVGFTHTAVFSEFSSGKQKWQSMPFQMISKVAEAFALRKGFSDRLTGLNIPEEKAAFENEQPLVDAVSTDMNEVMEVIRGEVEKCNTLGELQKLWRENTQWHNDADIIQIFTDRKNNMDGQ
jgi:phage recombination protein Bet